MTEGGKTVENIDGGIITVDCRLTWCSQRQHERTCDRQRGKAGARKRRLRDRAVRVTSVSDAFSISPLGDTLATVTLGEGISVDLNERVVARSRQVAGAGIIGVTDVVPAYAAIGIHYDPRVIRFDELQSRLTAVLITRLSSELIVNRDCTRSRCAQRSRLEDVAQRLGLR